MNIIDKRKKRLIEELKDKEYRESYVSSSVDAGIAFQIRALRKQRGLTQDTFASIIEMKQERISVLEDPSNSPSVLTLKKIAAAFEIGLFVKFVPIGDLVKWDLSLSDKQLEVTSFNEDPYFKTNGITIGNTVTTEKSTMVHGQETTGKVFNMGDHVANRATISLNKNVNTNVVGKAA